MEITLHVGTHFTPNGRAFQSFEAANLYCRGLLGRCSNVAYTITDGKFERSGSVDLEPTSFHSRHKNSILTQHLKTYAKNVLAAIGRNEYPFSVMVDGERERYQKAYIETLCLLQK